MHHYGVHTGLLYAMRTKPTAQIAHLVFAYALANSKKLKELFLIHALAQMGVIET